ncbi:MAG: hypothetical protein G3I11_02860 [Ferrovum sp.]|nr:hypothetical protein [Ferrovum sp.]
MNQTKITVKIDEKLLIAFNHQIDSLYIKRDAFLNAIIGGEIENLANDMDGKQLTSKANRYVAGELKRMGTRSVNIVVDKSTAEKLNTIVKQSNMVRDAFINRLILFLRSKDALLNYLELPARVDSKEFHAGMEQFPTSPLGALEAVQGDPFFYLRTACEERHGMGLYLIDLPKKLAGFSCFLLDSEVPGTLEFEKQEKNNELLALSLGFENEILQNNDQLKGVK